MSCLTVLRDTRIGQVCIYLSSLISASVGLLVCHDVSSSSVGISKMLMAILMMPYSKKLL